MPALPAVPKVVRVEFKYTIANDLDCLNRFFIQYSGTLSLTDAQTWVNSISAAYISHMIPLQTADCHFVNTILTDLSSSTSPQVDSPSSTVGSSSGVALPPSTCVVVSQKIARRFRGGHSRIYFAGLPTGAMSAIPGVWGATANTVASAWQGVITAALLATPSAAGTGIAVTVSYYSGFTNHTYPSGRTRPVPTLRATPVLDAVSSYLGNQKVASQRRRNLQSS